MTDNNRLRYPPSRILPRDQFDYSRCLSPVSRGKGFDCTCTRLLPSGVPHQLSVPLVSGVSFHWTNGNPPQSGPPTQPQSSRKLVSSAHQMKCYHVCNRWRTQTSLCWFGLGDRTQSNLDDRYLTVLHLSF